MTKTRRTFPESLKREAVEQVLAGTPLRHVAQAFDITESLRGKWKHQFQDAGPDAFPGRGKQSGEAAKLKRLRDELAPVTMERDVLKNVWSAPILQTAFVHDRRTFCVNVFGLRLEAVLPALMESARPLPHKAFSHYRLLF